MNLIPPRIPWDDSKNAGFTTGKPWLKLHPNYVTMNAEMQAKDVHSTLTYFKNIVKLRKQEKTLVYGKYTLLDKTNPSVYAYTREWEGKKMLILLN